MPNKTFTLKVGDKTFKLAFNIIFGEQLAKKLKCEPTPGELMQRLLKLNDKSAFLMSKAIVHCGILANDYTVGYDESIDDAGVGQLIVDSDAETLTEMFNVMAKELGFDLKAEPEKPTKKKAAKKK